MSEGLRICAGLLRCCSPEAKCFSGCTSSCVGAPLEADHIVRAYCLCPPPGLGERIPRSLSSTTPYRWGHSSSVRAHHNPRPAPCPFLITHTNTDCPVDVCTWSTEAVSSSIDSCIRFWDLESGEQTAVEEPGPGKAGRASYCCRRFASHVPYGGWGWCWCLCLCWCWCCCSYLWCILLLLLFFVGFTVAACCSIFVCMVTSPNTFHVTD